ncbi:PucR family transcriptional regulator [Natranaerobius thermophilus]|uniref:Putative transcriptional regulator, PucR family n=1 Tax=Natranaerobius thermophilus (strain ATCC BAA-1301 / DSM 18059 / JW/NM-WN-LF) TaxID=457570 RepID=B2A0Y4_NATTJ|nr:helix-turn-helix domain-containing protein [Natranaerobius thermophilus]ACB84607.1 putative transcriptional regulator, PucR family [Natranaerobius thermophilus JW/NM-WN-LF]
MSINIDIIQAELSRLNKYNLKLIKNCSRHVRLKSAKLVTGINMEYEKNIIYVGTASMIPQDLYQIEGINLVVINDYEDLEFDNLNTKGDIIEVDEKAELFTLFNDVQNIFISINRYQESSAALLNSLIRGRGLNYIVKIGSQILGNPVILADSSYKLLAYYAENEVIDPVWKDLTTKGYCSHNFVNLFKRQKLIEKVAKSPEPILVKTGLAKDIRRYLGKILIDDKIVGHLGVLEYDQNFKEEDHEITKLLCDVISSEMQKNNLFRNFKGVMYESLILDLLDKRVNDRRIMEERLKSSQWEPSDYYKVVTINVPKDNTTSHIVNYLRDRIERLIPFCKSVCYEGNIVLLLDFKETDDIENIDRKLKDFLNSNNLTAGVSFTFNDLMKLGIYYNQSVNALQFGETLDTKGPLFYFESYYIYNLLSEVSTRQNLSSYCHPAIYKIIAYDKTNGTDYYKTLYEYFLNCNNITMTAKKLYIHRNTMAHRLEKLKEITGLNFDDGEQCFRLFLSYKILELEKI